MVLEAIGSQAIGLKLQALGLPVIGVPKTIDNDLDQTDVTFGFDTAVSFATECIDRLFSTASSHGRVLVVEVMGRYAGWIALSAGMASGVHAILIPEIPFDLSLVADRLRERDRWGAHFSIVVVAEGAIPKGGKLALIEEAKDGRVERLPDRAPVVAERRLGPFQRHLVGGAANGPQDGASLRGELARYRALGNPAAWDTPLPPLPGRKLEPGQAWAGLAQLTQRLVVLGDLPPDAQPPALYDEALQNGVKAFQERHALATDGVIGKGTLDALAVSPAARAHQIALAMERLRWTPLLRGPRMIVVNIPEFMLRAYEVQDGRVSLQLAMKVIVGKALDTRTPLFDEDMRFIEFSPYWNIPPSIARSETIPRLRRDPGYLQQQGMEFVGANGQVHTTLAAEHLDAVLRGQMRIRQRPGPKNALGDIKFVFPNNNHIYLHHTPAPLLFQRTAAMRDMRAGRDFAVVGFDDIPEAAVSSPPLTTIGTDPRARGRQAAYRILARSRDATIAATRTIAPVRLVVRESCCKPSKDLA